MTGRREAARGQEVMVMKPEDPDFEVPPGVDRRTFMMRSAVIGSAAVITGRVAVRGGRRPRRATAPPPKVNVSPDLNVVKKSKGPVMTTLEEFYKVGPGPVELAHHRPDAHHLRLLPALHQAAGRPARQGDRHQGPPLRQPERDRQGARHGARRAGRRDRQGAGDRRARVPRRPGREAGPDLPGEARRQDLQRSR